MRKILVVVVVVVCLVLGVGVVARAQSGVGVYEFYQRVRFLQDVRALSDFAVAGNLTVGGDVVSAGIRSSPQATMTVGMNGSVTPGGSMQPLTSAANVGTSNIALGTPGDLAIFVNVGANTITLTDTGNLLLAGNAALGPLDTLTIIAGPDGKWVQVAKADN